MSIIWQLAWRFRASRHQSGFVSFISASSTLGIALGCFVLIVLLSVMNGFEKELKERLLSAIPHGQIWSVGAKGIENWQEELTALAQDKRIAHIEPYTEATGMLQKGAITKAIKLTGINSEYAVKSQLVRRINQTDWQTFIDEPEGVLLGEGVAKTLGVTAGDRVQLLLPQLSNDLSLKPPKTLWLKVTGTFAIGGELDYQMGLMHLAHASDALGIQSGAQGLRFQFLDPFEAPAGMRQIGYGFSQHVYMSDWTRTQGHLYQDIQLVRAVVYLVLVLVIAVACFNIVSTLVMSVNEKQSEIAMLMTMGADKNTIVKVFVLQGLINGLSGTLIGVVTGVMVADNLSTIARWLETVLGINFLSGDIYFINFLPSELVWQEVVFTALIALTMSLLATLYPARKAAALNPARSLGHK